MIDQSKYNATKKLLYKNNFYCFNLFSKSTYVRTLADPRGSKVSTVFFFNHLLQDKIGKLVMSLL